MKVVILAGGFGTRISEESYLKPKPMIEIGEAPILWHIMKHYSYYGYHEFIICCGYKGYAIKEYFADYYLRMSDVTFDFCDGNAMRVHSNVVEPWKVTLVDTGLNTMTGGRVKRIRPFVGDEPFMLTYGDGVSDVNLRALVDFHRARKGTVTLTAVQPDNRFGALDLDADASVLRFMEKVRAENGWVNGGFMVVEPHVFDVLEGDAEMLERAPFERLAAEHAMAAYKHEGFWQCMDTQRDKQRLEELWASGSAPWKLW